jgi:hypothetical protein
MKIGTNGNTAEIKFVFMLSAQANILASPIDKKICTEGLLKVNPVFKLLTLTQTPLHIVIRQQISDAIDN